MIFILSSINDISTDLVIDWLHLNGYPFFRLNSEDIYTKPFQLDLFDKRLYIDNQEINIEDIEAVWFRKFRLMSDYSIFEKYEDLNFKTHFSLYQEHRSLMKTIFSLLKDKKWLTDGNYMDLNKCSVLLDAAELGLHIPKTYIINSKEDILNFSRNSDYIIKSIYDYTLISASNAKYEMFTKVLTKEMLNEVDLPDIISPSLIQEKIDKQYEIRTFYINEKFFSMVIFSQDEDNTRVDSRENGYLNCRKAPYTLPDDVMFNTHKLMKKLNLNCGSIDYMKGVDGKYYFLEINPTGQYGMVQYPCNYNLHKIIAEELIDLDKS